MGIRDEKYLPHVDGYSVSPTRFNFHGEKRWEEKDGEERRGRRGRREKKGGRSGFLFRDILSRAQPSSGVDYGSISIRLIR